MIRPRYILCSESRIIDRATGLITHYNVMDELALGVGPPNPVTGGLPFLKFVMTAVWMRVGDENREDVFEFETYMYVPGEETGRCIHAGEFQFGEHRFHRLEAFVQGGFAVGPAPSGTEPADRLWLTSGTLRLESRIRRAGDDEWLRQEYLIPVRVEQRTSEVAESSQQDIGA